MLVVSLIMSAYATLRKAARAQRASVEAVLKLGGKVTYDYEKDPANPRTSHPDRRGCASCWAMTGW